MKTITFEGVDHEFPDDFTQPQISYALSLDKLKRHMSDPLIQDNKNQSDATNIPIDPKTGMIPQTAKIGGTPLVKQFLPRTTAIDEGGPGNRVAAYATDVASIPGRALASVPQIGSGHYGEEMAKPTGTNFVGSVLRSPSTAAMAAATPFTGGLTAIPALAAAGGAGALANQVDNIGQGGEFSIPQALGETAMNTAGGYVLGKAAPIVAKGIKSGAEYLGNKALQSFETAATKTILESLGYDPKKIAQRLPNNPTIGFIKNNPMAEAQEMKSVDLLHHPEKAYINLQSGLNKFGEGIGRIKDKADFAGVRVPIGTVASDLKNELINDLIEKGKGSTTFDSKVNEIIPKLESAISRMAPDENGTVPFSHAANFKSDIQDLVKNWGQDPNLSSLGDIAKKAQSKVGNLLTQSDNVYGPALDRFEAPYSTLKKYEPMIKDAVDAARLKASLPSGTNIEPTKHGIMHAVLNSVLSPKETLASKLPEYADRAANLNPTGPLPSRTPAMTERMYNPDTYGPENSVVMDKIAPLKEALKQATTKEEKQRILKLIWDVNYKNKQNDNQ